MDLNRRFAELVGLCWHEWDWSSEKYVCTKCGDRLADYAISSNPDFISHPTLVLAEMVKRKDWLLFVKRYFHWQTYDKINYDIDIPINYILDTTGLLVKEAIEFLERSQKP